MSDTETSEEKVDISSELQLKLKLGDIIEIKAPPNDLLNNNTFFIDYIDERRLAIIDVATLETVYLNLENGFFTDESIEEISLLSRAEEAGYARQNKLVPGTWIEIHIGGDVSTIITGEIIGLEEDQIEIRTVPELDTIFIDFEYKGLPETIPIKKIVIRDKPAAYASIDSLGPLSEEKVLESGPSSEPRAEYLDSGEMLLHAEEDAAEEDNVIELLRSEIAKSKEVIFGEDLEAIEQTLEIPENQRRYGVDLQTSSLLDELLSTIPANKRNQSVMAKIHTLISHFRELRQQFSIFDDNGDVRQIKRNSPLHKPLVEKIENQSTKIDWILPVVSLRKKIYLNVEEEMGESVGETIPIRFGEAIDEEENIKKTTYYNDRTLADESKYYKLYQQLADFMKPFENPVDHPGYLSKKAVASQLEAIIDNYDDFYSSVIHQSDIIKRRYVVQKYDLGLPKRTHTRQGNIVTTALTPAEDMYTKSIIVLPEPFVHWSRIRLPGTSMLERTNLNKSSVVLYRLFQKNKDIMPFVIDDLEKDYYPIETESGKKGHKEESAGAGAGTGAGTGTGTGTGAHDEFLSSMRHYILSDSLKHGEQDDRFERFLQAMIPRTRKLIQLMRKYIVGRLSFVSVVQRLEPFAIYPTDISFKQYQEIRWFLIDQIKTKKEHLETSRKEYGVLTTHRFKSANRTLSLLDYWGERPEFVDQFIDGYQLPSREVLKKYFTTGEIIQKCIELDGGVLMALLLHNLMSALQMPRSLAELLKDDPMDPMDSDEKIKATDCHRRVLAKKYSSTAELQKDNGKQLFFDKELDETPYDIIQKYKDQRGSMLPDVFERFLVESLIQKHDAPKESAEEMARNMIRGKKAVKEGEFAVVILQPEIEDGRDDLPNKSIFYERKSDVWVHHKDMDEEAFIDTQFLFCNAKPGCIKDSTSCSSEEEVAARMRQIAQKKIKAEFDTRYELASEDTKAYIKAQLAKQLTYIQRWIRVQTIQRERVNNIAYQIGLEAVHPTDAIISPHLTLRDLILGQTDFVKKQQDIVRLYDSFCREPMELLSEDKGWKYCRTTNTKLIPAFLYDLAFTYVSGGDYTLKLEELCHTHGLMSDNGDAIVDKFSGLTIRAIDFAEEDGYDDAGFKISTHAFIQKGEVEKAVENLIDLYSTEEKQICEGDRAQMVCNLLEGISKQLGHPLTTVRDRCVRMTINLCDQLIETEEKYNKEAKRAEEKKGIKLPPYKKRSQQLTILITATVLFMTIQTEIPSFVTKKVMPGCVQSFRGYPLSGEENVSGLQYMACVLSKMEKKMDPWSSLEKMTVAILQEQMKRIATMALKQGEMDDRYIRKREFLILNEMDGIPEEHSVQRWRHFLPPLVPIALSEAVALAPDFKDSILSAMRKGLKHQHADELALQSKIAQFGFSVISAIQKIVSNKELLLSSASTGTPFLQNVCCSEKERVPLLYFAEEDPEVLKCAKAAKALGTLRATIRAFSKAAFLIDPRGRLWEYPPVSSEITETNLYDAFIHYCQLSRGAVPHKFRAFFTDVPAGFPAKSSVDEQIAFLKRHDKRFTPAQLSELLQIVHKENIVPIEKSAPYHRSEILKDLMNLFDQNKSPVIDKDLQDHILDVLNKYDKTKLVTMSNEENDSVKPEPEKQKTAALKALKNTLAETIRDQFKPAVLAFFKKYGKVSPLEMNRLTQFMDTFVSSWATPNLYQIANFVKNTVYELTSVFPQILITNVTNVSRVHKYWTLAEVDEVRVYRTIQGYYEPLGEFRQDPVLTRLLLHIQPKFVDLRLFFQHLPIQEAIQVGGRDYYSFFDQDTVKLLLEYIFLSILHEYIIATDERELLQLDKVEKKRANRKRIAEAAEPTFSAEFSHLEKEYEEVYGNMLEVQIQAGNRDELKTRVAKMMLAFISITKKNKAEINISYENIAVAIRKRKEKEKNRIIEKFKNMSEDERKVEDMKKRLKMDEWNVGTQRGIFKYDQSTSYREVMEQQAEEALEVQKHGIRAADFVSIHASEEDDPVREMLEADQLDEAEADADTGIQTLKKGFDDGRFYSDDESDDGFNDN
jgi:hypothetical protein